MNLNQHDLFRNGIPGFVFALVILSFYAVTGRLETILSNQFLIVSFAGGFPLGFLHHVIYRTLFFCWWLKEETKMQASDAKMIRSLFPRSTEIERMSNEYLSHVLHYVLLTHEKNKAWNERVNFLFSSLHSFGASCLSIVSALLFMVIFKSNEGVMAEHRLATNALITVWIFIAGVFAIAREPIKDKCALDRRIFAERNLEMKDILFKS